MTGNLNRSIDDHPRKTFLVNLCAMRYLCLITSKKLERHQVPSTVQALVAVLIHDTSFLSAYIAPRRHVVKVGPHKSIGLPREPSAAPPHCSQACEVHNKSSLVHAQAQHQPHNPTNNAWPLVTKLEALEHRLQHFASAHLIWRTPHRRFGVDQATLKAPQH
jgi:hypothetical protein